MVMCKLQQGPRMSELSPADHLRHALGRCRAHLWGAAAFSALSNLLYLVPTLYMMQVYERVVPSGSVTTLVALSVVAAAALGCLALLEWLRARLLARAGMALDAQLATPVLHHVFVHAQLPVAARAQAVQAVDRLREGISGPAMLTLLDAPWFPIYVAVAFLLHPALGVLSAFAAAVTLGLVAWRERAVRASGDTPSAAPNPVANVAGTAGLRAAGLAPGLVHRLVEERTGAHQRQLRTSFAIAGHASLAKFARLFFSSAALGLGAVLAIDGSISAGAVFAASLLLSRALAPIEQLSGAWKPLAAARTGYATLLRLVGDRPQRAYTQLPPPTGAIEIEQLVVATPDNTRIALADINVAIGAGNVIGLSGATGSGKSTLLRAMTGAEPPVRGAVRFDGAALADWDPEWLVRHIGYLPESPQLFSGSVRDNIARFFPARPEELAAVDAAVIAAAERACTHDMILRLPEGYDTRVGPGGLGLSAGQVQRIAIARALFGDPAVLLFDEPTTHLDTEGQHDFVKTLTRLRMARRTVLVASQSGDVLACVDKLLLLRDGRVDRFGPVKEVFQASRSVASHFQPKASV